jgi:hypothetical protein
MSSRVFVPFDNNPTSVSTKNSSYTVPAGKYAKISILPIGYVNLGSFTTTNTSATKTFTEAEIFMQINGISTYMASQYYFQGSITDSNGNSSSSSFTYYFNFPSIFRPKMIVNSSSLPTAVAAVTLIDGTSHISILNTTTQTLFDALSFSLSSGSFFTGTAIFKNKITTESNFQQFWVSSGSVITVPSGFYYQVEEYNAIS